MRIVPLLVSLAAAACQSTRTVSPATPRDAVETAPVVAPRRSAFEQGEAVEIRFHGSWYPGHVLSVVGPERWEVAYDAYDSDWNQLVGPERIRAPQQQPQGAGPEPQAPPGTAVTSARQLREGSRVLTHWGGSWYPCLVRGTTQDGQVQISYVGYGSQWDETVPLDRVRLAPPGAEGFEPPAPPGRAVTSASELREGLQVLVLWGGTWYPSVVRSTTQDGQVRIGYVGYGEQSDETVSLERVRLPE
jgi:hypothetical protein